MTNVTNKIFVDKMGGRSSAEYIGSEGEIFYDPTVGDLRLANGLSGGKPINTQIVGAYRGFQAGCNQFLNGNESNVVQVFIHNAEAKVDYINYTDNTDSDDFYVTSLFDNTTHSHSADKVIVLNLYSAPTPDKNTRLNIDNIRAFVRKFIDTVLYDEFDTERNSLIECKTAFYDNIQALVQVLPDGTLFQNFTFDDGARVSYPEYNGPEGNASAAFRIYTWASYSGPSYADNAEVMFQSSGAGYSIGDQIVINGAQMHGVDGENDLTMTVTGLKSGNITQLNMTSGGDGFHPHQWIDNWDWLQGGSGEGAGIHIASCTATGAIVDYWITGDGAGYEVGDILTLNYGGADATFEVVSVGTDGIGNWQVEGTTYLGSPHRVQQGYWPTMSIDDGSYDQYDDGNYISTNVSTSTVVADLSGNKMTIVAAYKEGSQTFQAGMICSIVMGDGPNNIWYFKLLSQATDNSNVWFISENPTLVEAKVRVDGIPYGSGNIIGESAGFAGGDYVTVFDQGIFAMMAFNAGNINSVYYTGETGVDGNGYKETATLLGANGTDFGTKQIPQTYTWSGGYTLKSSDAGRHIYYNNGGGNSIYIPGDADVNFPVGTAISIVSGSDGWTYINAQNDSQTQVWGAGFNQTSTAWYIPENSMATLLKIGADKWMLSGAGLAID